MTGKALKKGDSPAIVALAARGRPYLPQPKLVQMSPKLAEAILDSNSMNRSLRVGRVEKYARDMKEGRWANNGETIKITNDGALLDGQHRLFAVIEANVTIPMLVVEGLDPSVMPTIDTGAARGFRDVLTINKVKNSTLLAGAARWLYFFLVLRPNGVTSWTGTNTPSHAELQEIVEKNPDLIERVSDIANTKRARRLVTPSILCFVYTMAFRSDPSKAGQWLGALNDGLFDKTDDRNPARQLQERMLSNQASSAKLTPMMVAALTIKSWEQYRTGKRTKTLRWAETESFPSFG